MKDCLNYQKFNIKAGQLIPKFKIWVMKPTNIELKKASNGRRPQLLKLKYLSNHWLDLNLNPKHIPK